jgi:chromate transport protein ChrA
MEENKETNEAEEKAKAERVKNMDLIVRGNMLKNVESKVKEAMWVLWGVGAINVIVGLVYIFMGFGKSEEEMIEGIIAGLFSIIIGVIFIILAFLAGKNRTEYKSILTGLVVYGSLILLNALFEPASIFQGIILKIIIIGSLIKGLSSAKEANELRQELEEIQNRNT